MSPHTLPPYTSRKLDLHVPPESKSAAAGYDELLTLLEELGRRLDEAAISKDDFRRWEQAVIAHLHDREIDRFMQVSEDAGFESATLPEQRWRNLRSILLSRKGLRPQIC